jgi:Domain of unknown function (DUF4424)
MKAHSLRRILVPMGWSRLKALHFVALLACSATSAPANDSTAELPLGGLAFTRSAEISVESAELTITPEQVTVRYVFLNPGQTPTTATVSFQLPEIDLSEADNYAVPADDPSNFVAFETKIDGKTVAFKTDQRAYLGNKDVSGSIRSARLPLLLIGAQQNRIAELPKKARDRLAGEGLLIPAGTNVKGQQLYSGGWTVKTSAMREQTFAPGQPVQVELRYRTSVGMSFDTVLRKGLRDNAALAQEVKRYRTAYCVADDLLRGIDRIAGSAEENTARMWERRISYVFTTGANWLGPVKDFRLVIDKGRPEQLVSFCLDNVKKITPTSFEVRMKDFTPERDLKILLIGKTD